MNNQHLLSLYRYRCNQLSSKIYIMHYIGLNCTNINLVDPKISSILYLTNIDDDSFVDNSFVEYRSIIISSIFIGKKNLENLYFFRENK